VSRARLLELLGLPAKASVDEIKSRYRELARKFHPDLNGGEHAHSRFRAVTAAYQELLAVNATPSAGSGDETRPGADRAFVRCGDPAADPSDTDGDGLDRRRAELRTRLARSKRSLHRALADARDGAAKAAVARSRGNEQMARHFERRSEADQGRANGLLGEIALLDQELRALMHSPQGM
jgi:curved DNA-binding protein CbpA